MGTDQLKELKRLQTENERLRRAVSDLTLDKLSQLVDHFHGATPHRSNRPEADDALTIKPDRLIGAHH